jgi:hypothetical protein
MDERSAGKSVQPSAKAFRDEVNPLVLMADD